MASSPDELTGNMEINQKEPLLVSGSKGLIPTTMKFSTPAAREWFNLRRRNIRPWSTFLNTTKFGVPSSAVILSQRVVKNVEHFQSNYLFVFLGLVLYCLLTSPLLLLAVAACAGACYIISLRNAESRLKVLGHELNLLQQYSLVCLVSIPLFFLAGAGSAVFWVIGASFFMIMLHASFYAIENLNKEEDSFELTMETV